METLANTLSVLIDKFKIKELILAILIVCGVILFAPVKFISVLGLEHWRDTYRSTIGLILLFCAVCCLIWFFTYLKNCFFSYERQAIKISRTYLKNTISAQEQEFLITHFFDFDRNEFKPTAKLSMTNGHVGALEHAYIICKASETGHYSCWAYMIQPNVRIFLNKAVNNKKIIVTQQGFEWKL